MRSKTVELKSLFSFTLAPFCPNPSSKRQNTKMVQKAQQRYLAATLFSISVHTNGGNTLSVQFFFSGGGGGCGGRGGSIMSTIVFFSFS